MLIPDGSVETARARGLLPEQVPHVDAAANAGRAALLVHALAEDPDRLWDATRDWLHQHYREPAMPRSYALVTALRAAGFAAVISGAGPSVLVLGRAHPARRPGGVPGSRLRAAALRHRSRRDSSWNPSHYGNTGQGC